jgi:hypothetical protein
MALESVDRAGSPAGGADRADRAAARTDAPHPEAHSRLREIRNDEAQANDPVDVRQYREVVESYRANQESLQHAMEGRQKILDAVREMMFAGGLESPEAARRAAEGILRRGSVA